MAEERSLEEMMDAADARTLNAAGNAFADRGMWNEALECYERAHEIDPADALIAVALGAELRHNERWDEAAEVYRTLQKYHPDHPSPQRFLERYEKWGHMWPTESGPESDTGDTDAVPPTERERRA